MVMSFMHLVILQIFIKHIVYLAMYISVGSGSIDDFYSILYTSLGFPNFLEYFIAFYVKYPFHLLGPKPTLP